MVKTSLIKKIDKENIDRIILFKYSTKEDAAFLKKEFDFNNKDIRYISEGYRDIGLIFNLTQENIKLNFDWSNFIRRVIIKNDIINKLDNVFVNLDFNKILLLSTKRLLKIDLRKLNEKVSLINEAINRYNKKVSKEEQGIRSELIA